MFSLEVNKPQISVKFSHSFPLIYGTRAALSPFLTALTSCIGTRGPSLPSAKPVKTGQNSKCIDLQKTLGLVDLQTKEKYVVD